MDFSDAIIYTTEANHMKHFNTEFKKFIKKFFQFLPFILMLGAIIWFMRDGQNVKLEDIVNYSPENPAAAAFFMWGAYILKTLSIMFPLKLLFLASGRLFSLPAAVCVNLVGMFIILNLQYLTGRFSGKDLTAGLIEKYPKLKYIREERNKNTFFFSFIIRAMGILPCDILSMYLGNTRMPYFQYITGSMLGFCADLFFTTFAGRHLNTPGSPWFWLTIIVNALISLIFVLIYALYRKKSRQ